ncbi:PD-(D/E)XK motif protein [uncultured Brevibacillus sp.]|uniref:PD-(D/E)XK motif protein n=1 Tax=uncultured Brevibacillus sp. TaxID=169970 RepID=UPI002599A241|nr:PD-(D/E)XK motif protein [uncultured Brevibacillus sp.]
MGKMIDIEATWQQIEDVVKLESRSGIIKRLIMPQWKNKIFLGVEVESGKRLFVLEAPYKILRNLGALPQTNGFEASIRFLGDEAENYLSLFLIVKKTQFQDLFVSLIKDILEHIDSQDSEKSVEIIISRLLRWQKFLEKFHFAGLSEEAQRGLYGELYFLNHLIEEGLKINSVVKAWRGPERTSHDFIFQGCSIEVKTSISKQHQKVYISSERQLDDSQSGGLYLCHFSLDSQSSLGYSLNQIIQVIREKLHNTPREKEVFEEKLFESGYLDTHSERYNAPFYSIRENNLFKVSEGFPRIVENDLIEGVGDVKYSIMISECKHYSVQESDVLQVIGDADSNE